jgi:nucleotide-binding universal stress UspA family protein
MTIIAGFSSSRQGAAPLNLAAQIARSTGEKVIAAAIVERAFPPRDDPVERDYLRYVSAQAQTSLERVVKQLPADVEVPIVVRQSTSIPMGLMELVEENDASLAVVGSSSSGLLGRIGLGSVTERLVHTASVPVAIAPRGYAPGSDPVRMLTAAYGGEADINGLIPAAAEIATRWSVPLRIVSFTVRPVRMFGGSIEPSAEDLVVQQWSRRTHDDIVKQLNEVRERIAVRDVTVAVGSGHDWREAVESVPWVSGDILLMGSGAAGPLARVFLGSAASKILRQVPVPVMIVPAPHA